MISFDILQKHIAKLRDNLDNIEISAEILSQNVGIETSGKLVPSFDQFNPLSKTEVIKLIKNSKSTTCELDCILTQKRTYIVCSQLSKKL